MPTEETYYQNENWDIWIGRNYGNLVLEGFVKLGDKLKYLDCQVDDNNLTTAVNLVMRYAVRAGRTKTLCARPSL